MSAKRVRSSSPDTDDSRKTLDYDAVRAEETDINKEVQSIKAELKSVKAELDRVTREITRQIRSLDQRLNSLHAGKQVSPREYDR
jgi:predicted  nucleic acid-binding Zn-ribbon protein